MQQFVDTVADPDGNIQPGVSITVKLNGAAAPIYSDAAGTVASPVPLTTDSKGQYSFFYSTPGTYTMWYAGAQVKSVYLDAPSNLSASTVTGFDSSNTADGVVLTFAGRSAANDGGGGDFYFSRSSTTAADSVNVFAPTGGGRLLRMQFYQTGIVRPEWAGARCDTKRQWKTVTMTSGSPALNVAEASTFVAADVGKSVLVYGAGAAAAALSATIAAYVSGTHVTLSANAGTAVTAHGQLLVWGTDDSVSIAGAIAALPWGGTLEMMPTTGNYYGVASPVSLPARPMMLKGSTLGATTIMALAPMPGSAVLYRDTTVVYGQRVQDITFDGSKVTRPGWVICSNRGRYDNVSFVNGIVHAVGVDANFVRGDGVNYAGGENHFDIRTSNDSLIPNGVPYYAGGTDLPSYGIWDQNSSDDWYHEPLCTNNYLVNFLVDTGSNNAQISNPHVYGYSPAGNTPYVAQYGYQFKGIAVASNVVVDTTGSVAGIDIQADQCQVLGVWCEAAVDWSAAASWSVQIAASLASVQVVSVNPGSYKGVNWISPRGAKTRVRGILGANSSNLNNEPGDGNTFGASAVGVTAAGSFQTMNGNQSFGGSFAGRSDGTNATILGNRPRDWGNAGALAWQGNGLQSAGSFVKGSAQWRSMQLLGQTVDGASSVLTADKTAAAAYNQIVVPVDDSGTSWAATTGGKLIVIARSQAATRPSAMWELSFLASRTGGTVTLIGSTGTPGPTIASAALAACAVAFSADAANKAIAVTVTGVAGHTIDWWCGPPGTADLMGST